MIRLFIIAAIVLAAAGMTITVIQNLTDEAIMTVVGVLCGIFASIPVSIGLLYALTREREPYYVEDDSQETEQAKQRAYQEGYSAGIQAATQRRQPKPQASEWTVITPEPKQLETPLKQIESPKPRE